MKRKLMPIRSPVSRKAKHPLSPVPPYLLGTENTANHWRIISLQQRGVTLKANFGEQLQVRAALTISSSAYDLSSWSIIKLLVRPLVTYAGTLQLTPSLI